MHGHARLYSGTIVVSSFVARPADFSRSFVVFPSSRRCRYMTERCTIQIHPRFDLFSACNVILFLCNTYIPTTVHNVVSVAQFIYLQYLYCYRLFRFNSSGLRLRFQLKPHLSPPSIVKFHFHFHFDFHIHFHLHLPHQRPLLSIPYNPKGQSALLSHRLVALKQFVLSCTSLALACFIRCLPCHSTRQPIGASKSH
jgi:hypothetical protein